MNERKKILIAEDSGRVFNMLMVELDPTIWNVLRVRAVDEAIGAVNTSGPFDCFVIDLQILATGLTLDEMDKYQDLEGYAFLKEHLWKGKTDEEVKALRSRTIICSKYVENFKKKYRNEIEGLIIINKEKKDKKEQGFEKKVASLVKEICL